MLLETGRDQVGSDGCSPHRTLLETRRDQVGSNGCSRHGMLLETGRYQWQRWMLASWDAFRNRTLPSWQRSDACRKRTLPAGMEPDARYQVRRERWSLGAPHVTRFGRGWTLPHHTLLGLGVTRFTAMNAQEPGPDVTGLAALAAGCF